MCIPGQMVSWMTGTGLMRERALEMHRCASLALLVRLAGTHVVSLSPY